MNGFQFIEKYFSVHPDSEFSERFNAGAGFFSRANCTYKYEKMQGNQVRVYFKERIEYRDQPIFENGKRVGIATLVNPYSVTNSDGTFICEGLKKLVDRPTKKRWRMQTVNIKRKFLSKTLLVLVDNSNLNLRIECDSIIPETYFFETIEGKPSRKEYS